MANQSLTGTTGTAGSALGTGGGTSSAGLADWAAPYITNYLGQAQALANKPYEVYQGPLTAGPSEIQNKVFQGIGNLTFPGNLGQSFTNTGAPAIGAGGQPVGGGGVAQQYMNPYLEQALDPQMKELQRQFDIQRVADAGRLTQAGAFGGSRQAIMESEGRRNLLDKQADVLGTGYATAYDKAMAQYNAEQGQGRDLAKMMTDIGGIQRGITSEGTAADLAEFNAQREFPFKQVQFQRDMISGLPTGSVTNTPAQMSGIAQLIASVGGIDKLLKDTGQGSVAKLLKNLGLNFGGGETA